MNKTLILGAAIFSLLAFFGANSHAQEIERETSMTTEKSKILIAYYSYSGNTKEVAEAIQKATGGDLFEIQTEGTYPKEYQPMTQQAKKEIQENFRPKLLNAVANISQYDTIFIGSPNWWGTITPQVSSFLASYDLSGKNVIPFITHGGGGVQNTITDLTTQCSGCQVNKDGWVGYGSRTLGIKGWLEDLGFKR